MITEYETDRHGNRRKCCIPCKDKRESKKATNEDEKNQKKRYYECKGLICGHNKNKYRCRECKGSSICEHEKNVQSVLNVKDQEYVIIIEDVQNVEIVKAQADVCMKSFGGNVLNAILEDIYKNLFLC